MAFRRLRCERTGTSENISPARRWAHHHTRSWPYPARGLSGRVPGIDQVIGIDEISHSRIDCRIIANIQHHTGLKRRNVIDGYIL